MEGMVKREYYVALKIKADRLESMWKKEHEENKLLREALSKVGEALMPFVNPEVLKFLEEQGKKTKGHKKEELYL